MRRLLAAGLLLAALGGRAGAQTTLQAAAPELDEETGELVVLLAGRGNDGGIQSLGEPQLFIDGSGPVAPTGRDKLLDYATDHPKWTPPIAIGVVYLWCTGARTTIMDGLEALFRHVPGRVAVYPTPYGQGHRQVVTKLTAARVAGGELADYPQIPGDQMKLDPAARFNAAKLGEDRAPLRLLYLITDGRGPAAGNRQWGPFGALGEDLRSRGLEVSILSLPAPVDQAEARANVAELQEAARARLVKSGSDLPAAIESLAEPLSTWERVRFPLPWLTRQLGGEHRLVIKATVGTSLLRAPPVPVNLPGRGGSLLLVGALGVVVIGAVLAIARRRTRNPRGRVPARPPSKRRPPETIVRQPPAPPVPRSPQPPISRPPARAPQSHPPVSRSPAPAPRPPVVVGRAPSHASPPPVSLPPRQAAPEPPPPLDDSAFDDVAEVVRVGLSPARAVLAIARQFGGQTDQLLEDPRLMSQPLLAGRAAQSRLRDIRRLVSGRDPRDIFVREVAPLLTGALREQAPAREAARRLRARLALDSWPTLLRLRSEQLEDAITAAAAGLPDLGTPMGRAYARDVQRELSRVPEGSPLTLWLVEAAGSGPPGRNVIITGTTTIGGPGSATPLTEDATARPNQAELTFEGNDVTLTPLDGGVEVDGEIASARTPLTDGQVVGIGNSLHVVRLVRRHVWLPPRRS